MCQFIENKTKAKESKMAEKKFESTVESQIIAAATINFECF